LKVLIDIVQHVLQSADQFALGNPSISKPFVKLVGFPLQRLLLHDIRTSGLIRIEQHGLPTRLATVKSGRGRLFRQLRN
jgi:hypothetical protein